MTKKSQKQKSPIHFRRIRRKKQISFNSEYLQLGKKIILTTQLSKGTYQLLKNIYKARLLPKELYEEIQNFNKSSSKEHTYIVLTQIEAIKIIRDTLSKVKKRNLQKLFLELSIKEKQIVKNHQNQEYTTLLNISLPQKLQLQKQIVLRNEQCKKKLQFLKNVQQTNTYKIRKYLSKTALKIQKQLFISSIVMIIESVHSVSTVNNPRSIVILEQAYPTLEIPRIEIVNLIGEQAYNQKVMAAVQIYEHFIIHQQYFNPTFLSCHDCMKVLHNTKEHQFKCQNVQNVSKINSAYVITPYSYHEKMIKNDYFEVNFKEFNHPYSTLYSLNSAYNQNKWQYKCNRYWCSQCYVNYKKTMPLNKCDFCFQFCECQRCKKYQNFIITLAHFISMKGDLIQLQKQFIFNRAFSKSQDLNVPNSIKFPYQKELEKMYQDRKNSLRTYPQVRQNQNRKTISKNFITCNYQNHQQNYFGQDSILLHKDQRNEQKIIKYQKKKIKKHSIGKQQQNKQILKERIQRLNQQKKQQFKQAFYQQIHMLKKKIMNSKIVLEKLPIKTKQSSFIRSKTDFQKKQQRFLNLPISYDNPFQKIKKFPQVYEQHLLELSTQPQQITEEKLGNNQQLSVFSFQNQIIESNKRQGNNQQNKSIYSSIWQ